MAASSLTGVQARVLLDQHRADRRAGLDTAGFVSGYQDSPLADLDRELERNRSLIEGARIVHVPGPQRRARGDGGLGSQPTRTLPDPRHEAVFAVGYGKAPGLDRAADAIRHGNWVGTDGKGGSRLVRDDPASKPSTLPSASEAALADRGIPATSRR